MSARCSPDRVRGLVEGLRNRVIFARWVGERAVTIARRELQQAWDAGRTGDGGPLISVVVEPASADADGEPPASDAVAPDGEHVAEPVAAAIVDATEPFAGYDTSPASHIVQRLRRMTADELRNAAAYEAQHRKRRTVLGMVDQLLAG